MKKKVQFVYPAIFVKDEEEGSYQAIFPDLNIYTDGKNFTEAYLNAKDLLTVFFTYALKYDTEFNVPTSLEKLLSRCKQNELIMAVETTVEAQE